MIDRYTPQEIGAVWGESEKFRRFLRVEQLLCEALEKRKKIPVGISRAFDRVKIDLRQVQRIEAATRHDIVAFIKHISPQLGKAAQYVHMGMTSSDLLDTVLAWQIKDSTLIILKELDRLLKAVKKQALRHKKTLCMARTHGVHAEVYSFGLKFLYLYNDLAQERKMLADSLAYCAAGKISGAVGTFAYFDPKVEEYICRKIGISNALISTQIVSRERQAYYLSLLALTASTLERFATEVRHLHRSEVDEAKEPFYQGQKGSSAMPHKQNPVICERICGLSRLLRGNMLAAFENINLWHERDISHSSTERVIIPDSIIALVYSLQKTIEVVTGLRVKPENMLKNMEHNRGVIYSQQTLLALMKKGVGRVVAYDVVQDIALKVIDRDSDFKTEVLKDPRILKQLSRAEVEHLFDPYSFLSNVGKIYKRFGL